MKKYSLIALLLLTAVACGDGETTTTSSSDTDGGAVTPTSASITISDLLPSEANATIDVNTIVDGDNPYGEGRMMTATGEFQADDGDPIPYSYEIRVIYSTYFTDGIQYGEITSITHTWGKDLALPSGISTCVPGMWAYDTSTPEPYDTIDGCMNTSVNPETHTIIFDHQKLGASPDFSTISGTVIY